MSRSAVRLALVRQRYNAHGGAERMIERTMPVLEALGVQVTLITRRATGWGASRLICVDPFHVGRRGRDRSFARAASAAWRRHGFDLVQSHERIPGCDVYRAGDGVHARWLEIRRAQASVFERAGLALSGYHRAVCDAERALYEHPRLRAVICNSAMVRTEILREFRIDPRKLHLIHNGVDLSLFSPAVRAARRAAARSAWGAASRDTVFAFVGSGFWRKGLDLAIRALGLAGNRSFRLVIAGDDGEASRFRSQAARAGLRDRVQFLGGQDDVRDVYAGADCLLLPTRYDPFPNAALEALAMGLPIVVGTHCGATEIVQEGRNGWVCPDENALALAECLHAVDRAVRDENAVQSATRGSVQGFGLDAMALKLQALYRDLLA